MNSLTEKLKALGVRVGAQGLPPAPPPEVRHLPANPWAVDQVIPGQVHTTPYGEAFVVEEWYPADYRHGNAALALRDSLTVIAEWGRANHLAGCDAASFLFLDTETTGLSGGTGTYAFLVGLGRITSEGFHLVQALMRDPTEEPALLAAVDRYACSCQAMVTYNGKAFDAPLLNTRYLMQGIANPLPALSHLDLLPLARRIWRNRLPSRSLGYVESAILGATRTQAEVPGWLIPQLYFDYLRSGDARPLRGVLYHNAMDILSLAALFSHTVSLLANPLELAAREPLDLAGLAALFEDMGYPDAAANLFQAALEQGLPEDFFWETLDRLALLHRKQHNWPAAVRLWERAAQHGKVAAHVELAKYYEHQERNPQSALQWTEAALAVVAGPKFPPYLRKTTADDLNHRATRLRRKCG